MTLQHPVIDDGTRDDAPDARSEVRWMSPATGLWVASRRGRSEGTEYAGMVERLDGTYHARSARGRALGSFADLDSARAVIDGGVDESQGAPRGVRAMVWAMIGSAAGSALALTLTLVR
jgi:hypothetical protein